MPVRRMLKISRIYTLPEIVIKIFTKKKTRNFEYLIYDHDLKKITI